MRTIQTHKTQFHPQTRRISNLSGQVEKVQSQHSKTNLMLEQRVKKLNKLQSKVDILERDAYTLRQEKDEASDQLSILQSTLREKTKDVARLEHEVSRASIQSASPEEVAALKFSLKQTQEALDKALLQLKENEERLQKQGALLERYEGQIALSEEAPRDLSADRVTDLTNALTSRLQNDFMRQQTETKMQYEASIKQRTKVGVGEEAAASLELCGAHLSRNSDTHGSD